MKFENTLPMLINIIFVVAISVPMVVSMIHADQAVSESEKRTLQPWPQYKKDKPLTTYFASINAYVNDHFGYREALIKLHQNIKYSLNESPVKNVVRGSNDWLFYKIYDPLMSDHLWSKEKIKSKLTERANYIKRNYDEFKNQGIAYQHIVIPNKMSLYPEYLPKLYALTDINATYDFFREQLSDTQKVTGFDAIDILNSKKVNDLGFDLYYKNDTHWNPLGAYYVYQEVVRVVQKKYPDIRLDIKPHDFKAQTKFAGDLANYIGLGNRLRAREPKTDFPDCTKGVNFEVINESLTVSRCNTNETSVYFIGDSFMLDLYPFISESVGTLYMSHQKTNRRELRALIEQVKPDLVIETIVERSLARELP